MTRRINFFEADPSYNLYMKVMEELEKTKTMHRWEIEEKNKLILESEQEYDQLYCQYHPRKWSYVIKTILTYHLFSIYPLITY